MKKTKLLSYVILLTMMFSVSVVKATTYYSKATGDWNSTTTWSGGTGSTYPVDGDIVNIIGGYTVTITAASACASLQIGNSGSGTLNFSGNNSLTVSGNITIGGSGNQTYTGTLTFSSSLASVTAGSLTLGGTLTTPAPGTIDMSSGGTLNVSGSITVNTVTGGNTWTPGTGTVNLSGNNTLPSTIFTTFNNLTISGGTTTLSNGITINNNLSITNGTLDCSIYNITGNASGTFSMSASTNLILGNTSDNTPTAFPSSFKTIPLASSSTVTYQANANQTISTTPTYGNLTLSGSGSKTTTSVVVNGTLTVNSNAVLSPSASTIISGAGTLTGSGTVQVTGTTDFLTQYSITTKTLTSLTVDYSYAGAQTVNNSLAYTNLTLSGSGVKTITGVTVSGILTVNSNAILSPSATDIISAGTLTGSGTVQVTRTTTAADFSTQYVFTTKILTNLTVDYSGAGNQSVNALSYGNLTIEGSGTKTALGSITVSGNLTISSGTLDIPSADVLTVNGTLSSPGTSNLILESNASGTATLIHYNSGVSGTAQRYVATDVVARYHYFSTPVTGANIVTTLYDANYGSAPVFYYTQGNWAYTGNITMNPGTGYAVRYMSSNSYKNISYTGTFNTGNIDVDISTKQDDYNLVGNPYPAPIRSDLFIKANATIYGAIYFWDDDGSGGSGYSSSDYATCTAFSGCTQGSPGHTPTGYISTGQAFLVQSYTNAGKISFTNDMKTTDNTQFFVNEDAINTPKAYLSMTDKYANYNEILIAFSPKATKGFDDMFDGRKIQGNSDLSFYTLMTKDPNGYVIQALPLDKIDTIPLGFYTNVTGIHTIKLLRFENLSYGITANLYDKYTKAHINLNSDSIYNFTSATGTFNDRLYIVFSKLLPANASTSMIHGDNTLCQNQKNVFYSMDPITNADEYEWSYNGKGVQLSPDENVLYMIVSDSASSGTLMVRGKNSAGYGDYVYYNLTIQPLPGNANTINGPMDVCSGSKDVVFNSTDISYANSYTWTLPDNSNLITSNSYTNIDFSKINSSGYITLAGTNQCGSGKPSSYYVNLLNKPNTPMINLNMDNLVSSSASGNQWYNEKGAIIGATDQTYIPSAPGNYYDIVTIGRCSSAPSNIISTSVNGLSSATQPEDYTIYPNPANDKVIVKTNILTNNTTIEIYSIEGHLVLQDLLKNKETEISISTLPKGMYIISIINDSKVEKHQLIKE